MQTKKSAIIQIVFATLFIISFFMTWVKIGMISITGIDVPALNAKLTQLSNLQYIFSPSKKDSTQIGYALYLVPLLSIVSVVTLFAVKKSLSKYLLFITALLGTVFSIYVDISVAGALKFSNIGAGSHLLLLSSLTYIALFFSPLMKKKKKKEKEREITTNL